MFLCRCAALMRASQTAFKSMGAIGVPSAGSPQHNRYKLWQEGTQTRLKNSLVSAGCRGGSAVPLIALELVADL